jgi:hypothetical protein
MQSALAEDREAQPPGLQRTAAGREHAPMIDTGRLPLHSGCGEE